MVLGRDALAATIATELKIPMSRVKQVLHKEESLIVDAVANGDEVQLTGFGTFRQKHCAARLGRNPHKPTETYKVPPKDIPSFKPGKSFTDAMKK